MEFSILGRVEAREGDGILVSGAGKPVALLALLLIHRNELVSSERLLDELWGGRAPRTALKTLQTYISQLRRALGEGVIATTPTGYQLSVAAGALDADRFEALVAAGGNALEHGDPAAAASALHEALALWDGPALGVMADERWAKATVDRLEEERLQALELRLEADLACGAQRRVVSELQSLVAEHPTREHLLELLMVALYRCGRQTDALEAYRAGRRRLVDDLGIEPTPRLRAIEQQILRHDPALGEPPERDRPAPVARRRWTRRVAGVAAVIGLAAAAAVLVVVERGSPASTPAPDAVSLIGRNGRVAAEISVGAAPAHAIRAAGFLWTSNAHDGTVSRVDFAHRTVETVPVGKDPEGLAFSAGEVWVADAGDGRVVAIDPRSSKVVSHLRVGNGPVALAARGSLLWVADGTDGTLTTIDARVGQQIGSAVAVGPQPTAVAADASNVWVALAGSGQVIELDRTGRKPVGATNVGNDPTALALTGHGVWAANGLDGTASRIDAETGKVDALAQLGGAPRSLATRGGRIWATLAGGWLAQFDARSGQVLARSHVGGEPAAVVADGSNMWMTSLDDAATHRGGTLRVETDELSECACFDPADYPSLASWQLLDLVYDGLVAYRSAQGPAGSSLVGDLARMVPRPDAAGRTYVFRLRPGVHFSNGREVRPSDVRASFERLFQLNVSGVAAFYSEILGAGKCVPGHRCDLSRGIVGGRGDTVTFHLAAPDPDFLYKLALPPAFVVPAESPMTIVHRPLPGTGPYRVNGSLQRHRLVLGRNPSFRVFATDATPDGFPDRIVATTDVSPLRRVDAIEKHKADVVTDLVDLPARVVRQLSARYPSQLQASSAGETEYLFLNTRVPPFSKVAARRAVNQAVDRARLVQLMGGPGTTKRTCQILPVGFPGYRPYCPYGLQPSEAGMATAPNLKAAASLVAASGTFGERVQVWAPEDHAAIAQYVAKVLRRLGYRALAHVVAGHTSRYYNRVGKAGSRAQVGWAGWIRDYTSPGDFMLPLFTCAGISSTPALTTNYSRVCSAGLDRRIRAADALQQDDPEAAQAAWTAVDRRIVDQALAVPFGSDLNLTLLSRRTGDYQDNPEFGVLLDQLWVH